MRHTQKSLLSLLVAMVIIITSCKKDDDPVNPVLTPSGVDLTVNETKTVTISGGVAPYKLSGGTTTVAAVELSGNSISVKALAGGTSSVTVTGADGGTATLNITVANPAAPTLSLAIVELKITQTQTVTVSGGVAPYLVSGGTAAVATAVMSGNSIAIAALTSGTSTLTVSGADGGSTKLTIKVAEPEAPTLDPGTLTLVVNTVQTVNISGSLAPYTVTGGNETIAEITQTDDVISIKGLKAGVCTVTVTGQDGGTADLEVIVKIVDFTVDGNTITINDFASGNLSAIASELPQSVDGVILVINGNTPLTSGDYNFLKTLAGAILDFSNYTFENNTIPENAFNNGGTSINSIILPASVETIGVKAFYYCWWFGSVTFAKDSRLKTISDQAFLNCSAMVEIEIPSMVESIGNRAFYQCFSLTSVVINCITPPTLGSEAFDNVPQAIVIYVPDASLQAYKKAPGWSAYANKIQAISSKK